ncbi:nuclear receptor-interacting protein 1 [Protopterus annectens]|uniref:nuclear receptor-interacting protein 1 n=1 Tax=Protopterus annectens TaxID=7888 RepID=UPI001CFACBB6|nr:nuclear receptor-interacting protein 1 [Protopterus annectens]XP_043928088.1 nuclear receptor-interacting protein 1 [Protopterus annectens]
MTYGEELGSDTHQDSVVLTFLEGLLMYQGTANSAVGTDKRCKAGHSGEDQNFGSVNVLPNHQNSGPVLSNGNAYSGPGMLHLKKARLLQSSEDWHAAKRRRLTESVDINGKKNTLVVGIDENPLKGKQDSTLLASLLQSFSSRLQTVALSQHIKRSLKDGYSLNNAFHEEQETRCYGVASHHLKTLLKKNRERDHTVNTMPVSGSNHSLAKTGFADSVDMQSLPKSPRESLSCAARLQAVANMVETRSSPAASPKPSVACSQLALLLSSEAHLQQYSREHTLKAHTANRLASERLAAMARLKDDSQNSDGCHVSSESPGQVSGQTPVTLFSSKPPVTSLKTTAEADSPVRGTFKQRDAFPKNSVKNCIGASIGNSSSLLLHLLKSQSVEKQSGREHDDSCVTFEESSVTPTTEEYSDHNPSFTDDDVSDDDGCSHSSCTPIDLSFKHRTVSPSPLTREHTSLENLTNSLLQNWDPKIPANKADGDEQELVTGSKLKPHQKVTLLQLLLGHKEEGKVDKSTDTQELQSLTHMANSSVQTGKRTPVITEVSSSNHSTPLSTPPLFKEAKCDSPINLSHQVSGAVYNPVSCPTSFHQKPFTNHVSDMLIDLSKNSKEIQATKPPLNETVKNGSVFSASKLLQNLARCGLQSSSSDSEAATANVPFEAKAEKPLGLFERLDSPLQSERSSAVQKTLLSKHPSSVDVGINSEIENLLERRTVLQLLLGNSHKGKIKKQRTASLKSGMSEKRVYESCNSETLHEQVSVVKIKQEPTEKGYVLVHHPEMLSKDSNTDQFPVAGNTEKRNTALSPSPEDIKKERLSPQSPSPPLSRNGLLSRLLRQNHDYVYPQTSSSPLSHGTNEMMCARTGSPCTVPKKRKLPRVHSDFQEGDFSTKPKNNNLDSVNKPGWHSVSPCLSYGIHQEDEHKSIERDPVPTVVCANVNNDASNYSREKSFNVLKQLLLSENCVRESSQPKSATCSIGLNSTDNKQKEIFNDSMSKKGETTGPSLHNLLGNNSQKNMYTEPSLPHHTFSVLTSARSPFPESMGNPIPKLEATQFNLVPAANEKDGPIKWVIRGIDQNEFSKDSPRLTKTNPILYYMLQKGANTSAITRGANRTHFRAGQIEAILSGKEKQVHIKQEPVCDMGNDEHLHDMRKSFSHFANKTENQNGNKGKSGVLGGALAIKNEPD